MSKPPYGELAGIAKHATDEAFLSHRDDVRWLARWADDIHTELRSIWESADVAITPLSPVDDTRQVTIRLTLTQSQIGTLLHLLDEDGR